MEEAELDETQVVVLSLCLCIMQGETKTSPTPRATLEDAALRGVLRRWPERKRYRGAVRLHVQVVIEDALRAGLFMLNGDNISCGPKVDAQMYSLAHQTLREYGMRIFTIHEQPQP